MADITEYLISIADDLEADEKVMAAITVREAVTIIERYRAQAASAAGADVGAEELRKAFESGYEIGAASYIGRPDSQEDMDEAKAQSWEIHAAEVIATVRADVGAADASNWQPDPTQRFFQPK